MLPNSKSNSRATGVNKMSVKNGQYQAAGLGDVHSSRQLENGENS